MKIFVLHYSKLTQRKEFILEQFERHGITNYEFIEKFDKDEITDDDCPELMEDNISGDDEDVLVFEDDVVLSPDFMNKLKEYMTQLPNDYDMLFIGDGCNLHIPKYMQAPHQYIYKKCLHETAWGGNGAARCTDSYVIHKRCAKKICDYVANLKSKIEPTNGGVDWWLNDVARDLSLNVYWAEPTIVTQGSQNGLFSRSL